MQEVLICHTNTVKISLVQCSVKIHINMKAPALSARCAHNAITHSIHQHQSSMIVLNRNLRHLHRKNPFISKYHYRVYPILYLYAVFLMLFFFYVNRLQLVQAFIYNYPNCQLKWLRYVFKSITCFIDSYFRIIGVTHFLFFPILPFRVCDVEPVQ